MAKGKNINDIVNRLSSIKISGQIINKDAFISSDYNIISCIEVGLAKTGNGYQCHTVKNGMPSLNSDSINLLINKLHPNLDKSLKLDQCLSFKHFWNHTDQLLELTAIPLSSTEIKLIIKLPDKLSFLNKNHFDLIEDLQLIADIGFWEYNFAQKTFSLSSTLEDIFEANDYTYFDFKNFIMRIYPDDLQEIIEEAFDDNLNLANFDFDFRYITRSGMLKYLKSKCNILKDQNGKAIVARGLLHDYTETKNAELKLAYRLSTETLVNKLYGSLLKKKFDSQLVEESLHELSSFFCLKKGLLYIDSPDIRELFEWNVDSVNTAKENFDVFFSSLYLNISEKIRANGNRAVHINKSDNLTSDLEASFKFFNIGSLLAFPLMIDDKQLGIFIIEHNLDINIWSNSEMDVFRTFIQLIQNLCERMLVENQHSIVKKKLFDAQRINNIGYFELDQKTDQITFSEGLYDTFNLQEGKESMDFASFMRMKHPEDVMEYNKAFRESLKTKKQYKFEYRFFKKDGTIGWAKEIGNTEFDAIGRPLTTFGTIQDISDLRQAKIAIEKFEIEKSTILDSVSESIAYIDKDKRVLWINKLAQNDLSSDNTEIIGEKFNADFFEEVFASSKEDLDYVFKTGNFIKTEKTTPKGKTIIVKISPVKDKNNFIAGIVAAGLDITDRIKAEESLKRNENRLKLATQIAKLGYWENFAPNGKQFWSDETYEILGINSQEEVCIDNFFNVIHPEDRDFIMKGFNDSINGHYLFEQEFRILRMGDEVRYIHSKAEHKYSEGTYSYSIGSLLDITDRKESEIALQDSEEKYRTLIESADDRIALFDKNWNILLANDAFYEKLGYTKDEYENLLESEKDFIETPSHLLETVNFNGNSEAVLVNYTITNKAGQTLHMSSKNVAIYDNNKILQGVLTIVRDITKQWEIETQVKKQQNLIQAIIDNMPIGFWAKDLLNENRFFIWNNYLENATGFTPDFAIGKSDSELFNENIARENSLSDLKVLKSNNMMLAQSEIYRNKYGRGKLIRETKKPIADETGRPIAIFGIVEDITEQKKSEEELIKAKEKAQESDRLKSTFLANMSHEIRTPLNGILGFAQLLSFKNITQEKKEKFINFIDINAKQLLTIISDIIDIAKIESGQFKIYRQDFELNDVLQNLFTAHSKELKNKEKEENVSLKLVSPSIPIKLNTDLSRFKQIFDNLINNAIKFTEKGSIEFGYTIKGELIEFFCKDTGIGIAQENHNIIFDRFRQVDESETREFGGTGLGLAISKNLVHLLGGDIWLESAPNAGSTFYFSLPYKDELETFKTPKIYSSESTPQAHWPGKKILIVDDVELIFEYISAILDDTEIDYDYANSGKKAIEMFKHKTYDLVLMDIQMPEKGGTETKNELRKINSNIPVIAQTANALAEDRKKYYDLGFDEYIAKPIDKAELLKLIGKFLNP